MRLPCAAAVMLLAGLAACSSRGGGQSGGAQPSYGSTGSATAPGTATSGTSVMNEAQARQNLSDHGYSNVANLHRAGDDWVGTAIDSSGKPVNFDINPAGNIVIMP